MTEIFRSVTVTEAGDREFEGIIVPFDETIEVYDPIEGNVRERFARGAFEALDPNNLPGLFWEHDDREREMPFGEVYRSEVTDKGQRIWARLFNTSRGNDAYELLKRKKIKALSVGADALDQRYEGDTLVRTKVRMFSASLVDRAAYKKASVEVVRSEDASQEGAAIETNLITEGGNKMTEANVIERSELDAANERIETLERSLAVIQEGGSHVGESLSLYRSAGEWIKALARNDEEAHKLYRVYSGQTSADTVLKNAWVDRAVKVLEKRRRVITAFGYSNQLPATGTTIEYPKPKAATDTVAVAEQVNEGDDLTQGEVTFETGTAAIKTYGGFTRASLQTVQRADVPYLDQLYRRQVQAYADATEAAARTALLAATGTNTATLTTLDVAGLIGLVVDCADLLDEDGYELEFMYMSTNIYKAIAILADQDDRIQLGVSGGGQAVNTAGSINPRALSGSVAGVPFLVDPNLADDTLWAASSEAFQTWESPNAPTRLQADNVVNLSQEFSVYGFAAFAVVDPTALVKVSGSGLSQP